MLQDSLIPRSFSHYVTLWHWQHELDHWKDVRRSYELLYTSEEDHECDEV